MSEMTIAQAVATWHARLAAQKTARRVSSSEKIIDPTPTPHTANTYRQGVGKLLQMLSESGIAPGAPLAALTVEPFIRFPAWITAEQKADGTLLALPTARNYVIGVMRFYNWLVVERHLAPTVYDQERLDLAQKDNLRKPYSRQKRAGKAMGAVAALVAYARELAPAAGLPLPQQLSVLRNKALVLLLVSSGLRAHEAALLKVGDVDLTGRKGDVIGKDNKGATFRFDRAAADALRAYLDARGWGYRTDDPLFAAHNRAVGVENPKHRHLARGSVWAIIKDMAAAAGGGHAWTHVLRHYFITRAYQKSGDLDWTRRVARHANPVQTTGYIETSEDEIEARYRDAFEPDHP